MLRKDFRHLSVSHAVSCNPVQRVTLVGLEIDTTKLPSHCSKRHHKK